MVVFLDNLQQKEKAIQRLRFIVIVLKGYNLKKTKVANFKNKNREENK